MVTQKLFLGLVLALSTVLAIAQSDTKSQMLSRQSSLETALKSKDLRWITRVTASDFVDVQAGGRKRDEKQMLAELQAVLEKTRIVDIHSQLMSLRVEGRKVTVVFEATLVSMVGAVKPLHAPDMRATTLTYEEVWMHKGELWQLHLFKTKGYKSQGRGVTIKI